MIALVVGVVAAIASAEPVAGALAPSVVGGKVPTRIPDLVSYVVSPIEKGERTVIVVSPDGVAERDPERIRVLGALGLATAAVIGALAYALARRAL